MTGDRGSSMRTDLENPFLMARQRPGKSASPSGSVHRQCMWSGSTTQASMWNGARARTCRTASRNAPTCVTSKSDRRSSRFTVKKNVPPRTRLDDNPARREYARLWGKAEGAALFRPTHGCDRRTTGEESGLFGRPLRHTERAAVNSGRRTPSRRRPIPDALPGATTARAVRGPSAEPRGKSRPGAGNRSPT